MLFHFSLPLILPPPLQNFLLDRTQRIAMRVYLYIENMRIQQSLCGMEMVSKSFFIHLLQNKHFEET